jgi:hypothetical protein
LANYILSYDLNGSVPSHKQVDEALEKLGAARGRILETVWYVGYSGSLESLYSAVNSLMSANDQLFVTRCDEATWRNLLISDEWLLNAWKRYR